MCILYYIILYGIVFYYLVLCHVISYAISIYVILYFIPESAWAKGSKGEQVHCKSSQLTFADIQSCIFHTSTSSQWNTSLNTSHFDIRAYPMTLDPVVRLVLPWLVVTRRQHPGLCAKRKGERGRERERGGESGKKKNRTERRNKRNNRKTKRQKERQKERKEDGQKERKIERKKGRPTDVQMWKNYSACAPFQRKKKG